MIMIDAYPQKASTLSKLMTFLMSSIQPMAAAAPGVCGSGVCGIEVATGV